MAYQERKVELELKVLNRYALNDVAHSAEWQTAKREITEQARFTGRSAGGTIHFHVTRWNEPKSDPHLPGIAMASIRPLVPVRFEVQVSPEPESSIAAATWRIGDSDTEVKYSYYAIGEHGELLEVESPKQVAVPERRIGFHQGPDKIL